MDASLKRSVLKSVRDLGVQLIGFTLAAVLAIASQPELLDAVLAVIPAKWLGLVPVVFLLVRVAQDQVKHRPIDGLDEEQR